MAGPTKKRNVQNESRVSKDSESSANEEIQVDFEGRNPESQDFHGIKQMLGQLFLKAHIDLSQLSDMLISQAGIGSVLKQSANDDEEDDDEEMTDAFDVLGITSIINITAHKETPCVQQLLALLDEMCKKHAEKAVQDEVFKLLNKSKIGLLINERIINIPAKISDPLLTSLNDEITRMAKKNPSYDFDYYIMICKLHKPKGTQGELIFANGEEEIFDKEALYSFEFDVHEESDTSVLGKWGEEDVEMIPYRRVVFINGKNLPKIISTVKTYVA